MSVRRTKATQSKHLDCEIDHFRPELRAEVVDLLAQLLGDDETTNDKYFGWKYEQNPHADKLLGIVALHKGKVVGFRGYSSARWHTGTGRTMQVLVPGDTCVDVNHRQKGLSVAMGKLAMTDYAATYQLFLNLSCTRNSLPGYLRLGFAPLADKVYLSRYGPLGLVRYVLSSKQQLPLSAARIRFGQFGDVKVSDAPMPRQMASIVERQNHDTDKFHLCQKEEFFRWRFADPAGKFVFYYRTDGDNSVAYLVMAVTPSNRRGYVVDYADVDGESCDRLFDFIVSRRDFSVLSVFAHSVSSELGTTLRRFGFHARGMMAAMEKKVRGNLPLLVRPVRAELSEDDWFVGGQDARAMENWSIKGICSDST